MSDFRFDTDDPDEGTHHQNQGRRRSFTSWARAHPQPLVALAVVLVLGLTVTFTARGTDSTPAGSAATLATRLGDPSLTPVPTSTAPPPSTTPPRPPPSTTPPPPAEPTTEAAPETTPAPEPTEGGAPRAEEPVDGYVAVGPSFTGEASYYGGGDGTDGGPTASGEVFDAGAMTAASRTLPFNTLLNVCYQDQCVVVRINDRGPYVDGRVLDLSAGAAERIGMAGAGIGTVTATPVEAR